MSHAETNAYTELEMTVAQPTYPKGQTPTEADIDLYYTYNVDLIRAVLHNFSTINLDNAPLRIDKSDLDTVLYRTEHEALTLFYDPTDRSIMLSISDPQCENSYDEMTAIVLSRYEARALRSLLNKSAL